MLEEKRKYSKIDILIGQIEETIDLEFDKKIKQNNIIINISEKCKNNVDILLYV